MYKINLLCDNIIKEQFLHKIANIFVKIGMNSSSNDDVYVVTNNTKRLLCETLIGHLTNSDATPEQINRIIDHNQLSNYDEVIVSNYIDIVSTLSKQNKCMSISVNTIFQLHIRLLGFTDEVIGWRTNNMSLGHDIINTDDVSNDVLNYCSQYEKLINDDNNNSIINISHFIIQMILINPFNNYNEMIICLLLRLLLYKAGYAKLSNCNIEAIILQNRKELEDVISTFIQTKGDNYHEWIEICGSILVKFFEDCVVVDNSDSIKKAIKKLGKEFTDYEVHKHCVDSSITKIRAVLNEMMSNGEVNYIQDGKNVLWSKTVKFHDNDDIRRGDKTKIVLDAIRSMKGSFCFSDLYSSCSNISSITIRKVLESEKKQGKIVCFKKGRSSSWQRVKF